MRLTTGAGVAVGGISGALIALFSAPATRAPGPVKEPITAPAAQPSAGAASATAQLEVALPAPEAPAVSVSAAASVSPALSPSAAVPAASVVPHATAASPSLAAPLGASPELTLPSSREELLKAELYCDQRRDFDECTRAALAHAAGSAGPKNEQQAARFRKITLTYLVGQCEAGSPHACFVLAAKYRDGSDVAQSNTSAEALERRGRELCQFRSAPECPGSAR